GSCDGAETVGLERAGELCEAACIMRPAVAPGTVVASFRVESLLGEGATGAVYLAKALASDSRVALKLLSPELARDERFRQRFLREEGIVTFDAATDEFLS